MKKITILLAIIGFFNLSSAQTLDKTNYLPGSIGGSIDVSPTGVASYQIPIAVSPGSNGMQPRLSIVYSSQGGSGLLGWGWNISGLSKIYKVNKNPYYDGGTKPAAIDSLGALAMDGTRLILSSTANVYNPENDPYTKVEFKSASNTFTVTYKDGLTMEYGTTAGSLIVPKGCIAAEALGWALSKVTDYNRNYISFTYSGSSQTGEYLIDEIAYTGNESYAPYAKIKFAYDENIDYSIRFNFSSRTILDDYNGAPLIHSKKITSITNTVDGITSNSYTFDYKTEGHTKLEKIGYTSNGKSYNPTIISWNDKPASYVASDVVPSNIPSSIWGTSGNIESLFADFNGDGITDIARTDQANTKIDVGVANGSGGYSQVSIPLPKSSTSVESNSDYTSITTTITISKCEVQVADSTTSGANRFYYHYCKTVKKVYLPKPNTSGYDHTTSEYFDMVDAFKLKSAGYAKWNTYSVTSTGATSTTKFYYRDTDNDGITDRFTIKGGLLYKGTSSTQLALTGISSIKELFFLDYDGDGQQELLLCQTDRRTGTNTYYILKMGSGATFWFKKLNIGLGTYGAVSMVGDYNSDGRDDLMLTNLMCANGSCETGAYFFNQNATGNGSMVTTSNPYAMLVDDIDGDGVNEFIYTEGNKIIINRVRKDSEETITTITAKLNVINSLCAIDLNNDGQKELIYGIKDVDKPYQCISFNTELPKSNLVKTIFDGMGNLTTLTYGVSLITKHHQPRYRYRP